jgi:hypothetical protein
MKYIRMKATEENQRSLFMAMTAMFPESFSIMYKIGRNGNVIRVYHADPKKPGELKLRIYKYIT